MSTTYHKKSSVVSTEIDNATVLYTVEKGSYFSINETGLAIWEALSNHPKKDDLLNYLAQKFNANITEIEPDITAYLTELLQQGLITETHEATT